MMSEFSPNKKLKSDDDNKSNDIFEHKANSSQHNLIFAAWLINKFGSNQLRSKNGVIDIAGGAGYLSFELTVRYGIQSTVIDPRKPHMKAIVRRKMRTVHKNRIRNISVSINDKIVDKSPLMEWVKNIESLNVVDDGNILSQVEISIKDKMSLPFDYVCSVFPPINKINDKDYNEFISNASILIGMHSDQATECIIDTALKLNLPFAVVPCCIFSNLFPGRKINGRDVCTYHDFVEYLKAKDVSILSDTLPFFGRNIVLYRK